MIVDFWTDWNSFYQVHGHPEYGTKIEFDDSKEMPQIGS